MQTYRHSISSEAAERELRLCGFALSPYLLAVNLAKLDFSEGAPARKLNLTEKSALVVDGNFVSGEVSRHFVPAKPFTVLGPTPAPAK